MYGQLHIIHVYTHTYDREYTFQDTGCTQKYNKIYEIYVSIMYPEMYTLYHLMYLIHR